MIQIIFIYFILQQVQSKLLKSVCMDDFLAVNKNQISNITEENEKIYQFNKNYTIKKCFDYMENYTRLIFGYNVHSECFIQEDQINLMKGDNSVVNRCGEWLQIVGPSQRQVLCMIAGTHSLKSSYFQNVSFILLSSDLFSSVTSGLTSTTDLVSPVVVARTDFDLGINPSLVVTYTKKGYNILHVINTNRLTEKISIMNVEYFMKGNNWFEVPYKSRLTQIVSVLSFDDERIDFNNVDLTNNNDAINSSGKETIQKIFSTNARFENKIYEKCHYLAENFIYDDSKPRSNLFYKWVMTKRNVNENMQTIGKNDVYYSSEQRNYTVDIDSEYFNLRFSLSPSATVFTRSFKYLEMNMEADFDLEKYQYRGSYVYAQNSTKFIQDVIQLMQSSELPTKYYVDQQKKLISIRIGFPKTQIIYADHIITSHRIIGWKSSDKFHLKMKNITFIRNDEYAKQASCNSTALMCKHVECQIEPQNFVPGVSPWESVDCIGDCGICQTGFFCNASGKCEIQPNRNTRSWSVSCLISIYVVFILFIV